MLAILDIRSGNRYYEKDIPSCNGYLDHPFKNRRIETEKEMLSLLANTGGWM
jgi:hypothetical protein